jgi:opacity protein-like surface antigen
LSAFDNHWFRADINPSTETGHGWGTQLEGILSYAVTDRWSIGLGGRYWFFKTTDAETQFPGIAPQSPEKFHAERYGVFFQTSYKFDGSDLAEPRAVAATGMPLKAAPKPIVAAADWTGLYIGGHAGGGWGRDDWNNATGVLGLTGFLFPGSADVNGLIGGGQIGYNYQWGSWVFGVQADADAADIEGTAKCATFGPGASGTCQNKVSALGSITGRFGESVGKFLLYTDAGAAWARDNTSVTSLTVGPLQFFGDETRWGWTLGGGIAYALTPNWSVFGEYDYYALGSKSQTLTDSVFGQSVVNIDEKLHLMKIGANYKF